MPQPECDTAFLSLICDYYSQGLIDKSMELTELYKAGEFGTTKTFPGLLKYCPISAKLKNK